MTLPTCFNDRRIRSLGLAPFSGKIRVDETPGALGSNEMLAPLPSTDLVALATTLAGTATTGVQYPW